jgi:hypothetical protein
VVLVLAGCWTGGGEPVSPRVVGESTFVAPPPENAIEAPQLVVRDGMPLGNADRGCTLMVERNCQACHFRGREPRVAKERHKRGVDAVRVAIDQHGELRGGPLSQVEREDLVTCLWERWF